MTVRLIADKDGNRLVVPAPKNHPEAVEFELEAGKQLWMYTWNDNNEIISAIAEL